MTMFSVRIAAVFSAFALAASVGAFAAQAPKSTDLLTSKQVQELVATAQTPADHVKLQKHFLAVAAKYDAEAAEHADLAKALRKNPTGLGSRPGSAVIQADHCDRLAGLTRDAAKESRELAAVHGQMASAK
jgi:hypothetical protein